MLGKKISLAASLQLVKNERCHHHVIMRLNVILIRKWNTIMAESNMTGDSGVIVCIMDADRLGAVYEARLVPFIKEKFPDGHRLYQDNDPKHASKRIEDFLVEKKINWWYSPPESPDLITPLSLCEIHSSNI